MNLMKKRVLSTVLVVLLLLVGGTAAYSFSIPGFSKYTKVKPVNGLVTIPVAKVNDGKVHFFRLVDGGKEINFFVAKGSDGALHTAFDACDVCYKEKKGYVQDKDHVVCKNCNKAFPINKIGAASAGGCNPAYLPSRIYGNSIAIGVADLKAGARFF
ncbi:DUF2318 domain-containing protein [Geomesophilobacter sediminis]|uniref:DUF2318 domain-containing protein n=1 Tax=Geomesophilobacter sediminis TaxID=2798584 RepID=A0A8J7M2L8_9BACT|nr:DUF2318 domain-containing protein [Geomesophilobacter sediminis]MBJ6727261.1 DUF2318 domain-containing protein [Geomesophilobacter sediminis]